MRSLDLRTLANLVSRLKAGSAIASALPDIIGDNEACGGFWRFYSHTWPLGGIQRWNGASQWKEAWRPLLGGDMFAFGEDVFGNQLVLLAASPNVFLWQHENGSCEDLLVGPSALLKIVIEQGIEWIDRYRDGSLAVAQRRLPVDPSMHLHWVTPLILGGAVTDENVALVEREPHLVGHAKLWAQIGDLPPGTRVAPT